MLVELFVFLLMGFMFAFILVRDISAKDKNEVTNTEENYNSGTTLQVIH